MGLLHVEDAVAVDVVLLQLVHDKGTEGLYLPLVVCRQLLGYCHSLMHRQDFLFIN